MFSWLDQPIASTHRPPVRHVDEFEMADGHFQEYCPLLEIYAVNYLTDSFFLIPYSLYIFLYLPSFHCNQVLFGSILLLLSVLTLLEP